MTRNWYNELGIPGVRPRQESRIDTMDALNEFEGFQLDREDIVLLLVEANERLFGRSTFGGITRLEKLIFLLQKETDFRKVGDLYEFTPHNFGPFSKEVYEAIDFLESCDLIETRERAYSSYYANKEESQLLEELDEGDPSESIAGSDAGAVEKMFSLTKNGREVARKLRQVIASRYPKSTEQIDSLILRHGNLPLNQLIRYVYRRYPETTTKSIHPEAGRMS